MHGLAEGETSGMTLGQRQTLKLQLETRFGQLPDNVLEALAQATVAQLEHLAIALLDARSVKEALDAAGLRT